MARRWGVSRDATLLIGGQAVRAAGYGFSAVILGALLAARGYSHLRAGLVLTALIAGTALASLVVGALADRVGRCSSSPWRRRARWSPRVRRSGCCCSSR
jgi:MFS family permease